MCIWWWIWYVSAQTPCIASPNIRHPLQIAKANRENSTHSTLIPKRKFGSKKQRHRKVQQCTKANGIHRKTGTPHSRKPSLTTGRWVDRVWWDHHFTSRGHACRSQHKEDIAVLLLMCAHTHTHAHTHTYTRTYTHTHTHIHTHTHLH